MPGRFGQKTDRRQSAEPEHILQCELVAWIRLIVVSGFIPHDGGIADSIIRGRVPGEEWGLIHSIPNGGKRQYGVAVKMWAEGQVAGAPDLFWALARCGYHGLYLETKVDTVVPRKGKMVRYRTDLSEEQRKFKAAVERQGFAHRTYRSFDEGRRILLDYYFERLKAEDPGPVVTQKKPQADIARLAVARNRRENGNPRSRPRK